MTALRGCPRCLRYMRWDKLMCNECSGWNTRASIKERLSCLAANLHAVAIEELRLRNVLRRMEAP